jgi:beta-mannosidase
LIVFLRRWRQMQAFPLTDGWFLKERDPDLDIADDFAVDAGWLPASVPGTVHQDLLTAGRIPDPFVGLKETQVQWVGERDWLYRCAFVRAERRSADERATLCCNGLDTVATVWLNGQEVLRGDNMFVPYRVPITASLRPGRNELHILFQSALRTGQERERQQGCRTVWNGDPSRVYIRKAQYHWGWDWGPCLLTAGP